MGLRHTPKMIRSAQHDNAKLSFGGLILYGTLPQKIRKSQAPERYRQHCR